VIRLLILVLIVCALLLESCPVGISASYRGGSIVGRMVGVLGRCQRASGHSYIPLFRGYIDEEENTQTLYLGQE
jgi:hypothetical protein